MIEADERTSVRLDFETSFYKELRKTMFRSGISVQDFFSYVIRLIATGDSRIHEILLEAKQVHKNTNGIEIIHTDKESLFNLIEGTSPFGKG